MVPFSSGPKPTRQLWWHSIYQPQCQLDQSDNDDCAEDNELSENKPWSVGRANFDYYAPRAHRNVNDVLSTDCALARWRTGVLLRRGGRSHFNEVSLESSIAPSGRPAGLRPAKAIASIPIAKSEPRTAFALSHLSNSCGFLR